MNHCTLWVLARANDEGLASLRDLPDGVTCIVGAGPEAFDGQPPADAILLCSMPQALPGTVARAPNVRWIHSRSAGVEAVVSPELADAGITLTNGRGAFSLSLAEFVMTAVFHFAKEVRRLTRNQAARRWEQFAPALVQGQCLAQARSRP